MKNVHGIWLPDGDQHFESHLKASEKVQGKRTYQLAKYKAALRHVPVRRFAVDVGGHVGLWSRVMAYDFQAVHAFEPMRAHRECFAANVERGNVHLFPYAISNEPGQLLMSMPFENTGHTQVATVHDGGPLEQVFAITLDSLEFEEVINFLKIDVEGYELFAVQGAEETIRMHKPVIIIEQKPNGNAEKYGFGQHDAVKLLKSWGMKEVAVMSGDHIMVW